MLLQYVRRKPRTWMSRLGFEARRPRRSPALGLLPTTGASTNASRTFHPITTVIHFPPPFQRKQTSSPSLINNPNTPLARADGRAVGDALLRSRSPHANPDRSPRVQIPDRTIKIRNGGLAGPWVRPIFRVQPLVRSNIPRCAQQIIGSTTKRSRTQHQTRTSPNSF